MSLEVKGGVELRDDVARMADLLRTSGGNGARACNYILHWVLPGAAVARCYNACAMPIPRAERNAVQLHGIGARGGSAPA